MGAASQREPKLLETSVVCFPVCIINCSNIENRIEKRSELFLFCFFFQIFQIFLHSTVFISSLFGY
jgi:hypothetical protein